VVVLYVDVQGTEFCDTGGFDTLVKHMQDGRKSCRSYLDFIRQRFAGLFLPFLGLLDVVLLTYTVYHKKCATLLCQFLTDF